jgi:hypothetical protein
MRETIADKANRYLIQARVTVTYVQDDRIAATCRGDGQVYKLGHDPRRSYFCSCPARNDQCCHLAALRLITVRRSP